MALSACKVDRSPFQAPVKFEDVIVYFLKDEWKLLEQWQKNLYWEVLTDNYEALSMELGTRAPVPVPHALPPCQLSPGLSQRGRPRSLLADSRV
uniref:KRAB domain-containing protein n=1 Tax=Varanus komodoensis TaxID=61221 RepID=A0A8D2JIF6_VARKO